MFSERHLIHWLAMSDAHLKVWEKDIEPKTARPQYNRTKKIPRQRDYLFGRSPSLSATANYSLSAVGQFLFPVNK
jgi:hypothetical protein